jgi:hypothetical protein
MKSSQENFHDKTSTQNKTQYNSNTKISIINHNDRTPMRGFDDSMLALDKNLLGNDLFTDINLLNIEMKALHTPRELKDKLKNFDFSEINVAQELANLNDKSSMEFDMNKSEIKNLISTTNTNSKNKDSKSKNDKSMEKRENEQIYKKINLKNSINTKKAFNKTPNKTISPIPNSSRNVNKNLSLNVSKKNTIESIKKDAGVKSRRVDKFLNNNPETSKKSNLLKLDFKSTLRNYNPKDDANSRSPYTTKSNRNKSTDLQINAYRQKTSQDKLINNKTLSSSPKKREKLTVSHDNISESFFVKQIRSDKDNIMKVLDFNFGRNMEKFSDDCIHFLIISL